MLLDRARDDGAASGCMREDAVGDELVIAALLQNQPLVAEELWQVLATESGVALMGVQP